MQGPRAIMASEVQAGFQGLVVFSRCSIHGFVLPWGL